MRVKAKVTVETRRMLESSATAYGAFDCQFHCPHARTNGDALYVINGMLVFDVLHACHMPMKSPIHSAYTGTSMFMTRGNTNATFEFT